MKQDNQISDDIKDIIRENLLINVEEEESLFQSEKIDGDFLLYLLPILENKYDMVLDDSVIRPEYLDSVRQIAELFKKER